MCTYRFESGQWTTAKSACCLLATWTVALTSTLLMLPGVTLAVDNLLQNPGFEVDPLGLGLTKLTGWQVVAGTVDLVPLNGDSAINFPPVDGAKYLETVGTPGHATIVQSFPTTPGREYDFSGWMAHHGGIGTQSAKLKVFIDDKLIGVIKHNGKFSDWRPFLQSFIAKGSTTQLKLVDVTHLYDFGGGVIDGLVVNMADEDLDPVYWVGDQATCDFRLSPPTGSWQSGNFWENYKPPTVNQQAVFEVNHVSSVGTINDGTISSDPHYIHFGDWTEHRQGLCINDANQAGGVAHVGQLTVHGGAWTFDFGSNSGGESGSLSVSGRTTITSSGSQFNAASLVLRAGAMTSSTVRIGGDGPGSLKIAEDAVLTTSTVIVDKQGILSGKGTIHGQVIVNGGIVQPGASPGTLHIAGDLYEDQGGTLEFEIAGNQPGSSYDELVVDGEVDIAGSVVLIFQNGFVPQMGDRFDLFRGSLVNQLSAEHISYHGLPDGYMFHPVTAGGVISIEVTSVPEPSTCALSVSALLLSRVFAVRQSRVRAWL